MFTLFKSSPKFPVVQPVDMHVVKNYMVKFEESLRNFEEMQKENLNS
ncbi:hypothetical protein [Algoriphagus sp. PAP.12]|nr:hypothetical protein [Algoriphagus sp. PAP.12]